MLLAEVYASDVDVSRYWMSEKFDSVRAHRHTHHLSQSAPD